ncbi:MAG TPA: heme A synthase, partial [Rhodospirillaceae bacterium]|nr:heme A synthase [Rhodospirillaceae bacterium]
MTYTIQSGKVNHLHYRNDRAIGRWLFVCAAMVFIMIVIGGITRLTESGLSIVYWRPVTGFLPPLTGAAWLEAFEAYRNSPQYLQINA